MKIVAIILTRNEEKHLARCIASIRKITDHIVVIDCFSSDSTIDIARALGVRITQHQWRNYSNQFNWALSQLDLDTEWVIRIDADEVLTTELIKEIRCKLPKLGADIHGVYCGRRIIFLGNCIRYGGLFPIRVLRIFRYGHGQCENRWMDEHIKVVGSTADFQGDIVDENLNSLTWWVDKHNSYASREAVDLLNLQYHFMPHDSVAKLYGGKQTGIKRWIKEYIYARIPLGLRALVYFFYRYVVRLGFLDGRVGAIFHFLQGFWYRFLVDAKIFEVKRYMVTHKVDVKEAIEKVLDIRLADLNLS